MQNYDIILGGEGVADPVPVFSGLSNSVRHASFSPDTRLLIGIDAHNNAIIWDTETGVKLASLPDTTSEPVWSPDSRMVAMYGTDGYIHIIEAQTGKSLHIFTQHLAEANKGYLDRPQVIWSPDARNLAILDQGALFIYEMQGYGHPDVTQKLWGMYITNN
jgi:WD40 repeat protein